jgi:thiol-disulfide isomerase/thioredoxin
MNPLTVAIVLVGLIAVSTALGLLWRARQGHISHENGSRIVRLGDVPELGRLASGATLLQFSTEVCAPCVTTHAVLGSIAAEHANVRHVDVDLTHRPDLASQFRIMQTPTTLILDGKGVVRARIGGAPRRDTLRAELHRILLAA